MDAAWTKIYSAFYELCGAEMPELPLMYAINQHKKRILIIEASVKIQRDCLQIFGFPLLPEFETFKRYGHTLTWNEDKDKFLAQLTKVETKEKKYHLRLAEDEKSLENMRLAQGKSEAVGDSRIHFISMLNILSKEQGYPINRDLTTVEDLGILIGDRSRGAKVAKAN